LAALDDDAVMKDSDGLEARWRERVKMR